LFTEAIEKLSSMRDDAKKCDAEIWKRLCICHVSQMSFSAATRNLKNWKEKTESNDKDWMYYDLKIALGLGVRIQITKFKDQLKDNIDHLSNLD